MRLFLYLLALLTGLSVAEAGQIARAAPVAMDMSSASLRTTHATVGSEKAQPATPLPIMLAASGERRLPLLLSNLPHQMDEPVTRTFVSDRSRV